MTRRTCCRVFWSFNPGQNSLERLEVCSIGRQKHARLRRPGSHVAYACAYACVVRVSQPKETCIVRIRSTVFGPQFPFHVAPHSLLFNVVYWVSHQPSYTHHATLHRGLGGFENVPTNFTSGQDPLPHTTCERTWEKVGCFRDRKNRALPELLVNDRDKNSKYNDGHRLNWKQWNDSLHR